MERTKKAKENGQEVKNAVLMEKMTMLTDLSSRLAWANRMGFQYGDDRKIYQALGYPTNQQLTFKYYWNKYDRQDIASAIIERPVDKTWNGDLTITEEDTTVDDSDLSKAWMKLDRELKVKQRLTKVDKLAGIGQYAILLFGFNDVKKPEDWIKPTGAGKKKLVFLKQISEEDAVIKKFETKSSNKRFGQPTVYEITIRTAEAETGKSKNIQVHHSRVLHIKENSLVSEVYGRPRLKPIINRLEDLEKLLGGDAEMFWRGARPGYHAKPDEGFEVTSKIADSLQDELDKYEHDLRRFIIASGVDIKNLEQQVADPLNHIDAQIQAIAAQTGIPKRILIGSERGELSSTQDKNQWLELIKTRMDEFAEPEILRPFVNKCMLHGILPKAENYVVVWEDVFAPSEKDKVEVGSKRAEALKVFAESPFASEIMPPALALKYLFGLTEEQIGEIMKAAEEVEALEDRELEGAELPDEINTPPPRRRMRRTT